MLMGANTYEISMMIDKIKEKISIPTMDDNQRIINHFIAQ